MAAHKAPRLRPQAKTFLACLRQFLTPALWKQAHQTTGASWQPLRWQVQPLLLVLLTMTWCCGDSQAERFEAAKAFCVVCRRKQKRPGQTVQGFQKALTRLPMPVLRVLARGLRQRLAALLDLTVDGFIPLGCDGSRLNCPRSAALERFLCEANPNHSAPSIWLTAVVHLRWGVPWCWWWGKGNANERWHLQQMLPWLPAATLLVADAGYIGYELLSLLDTRVAFLIRGCSKAPLYTTKRLRLETFQEGECLYWPQEMQKKGLPPLRVRALRLPTRATRQGKRQDVWLLTNVLSAQRLSRPQASRFYRWRWENEGLFRTYKRTLKKVTLASRTVALVHREAEGSLLALQVLLAQGAVALAASGAPVHAAASPRQILLEIRREIRAAGGARRRSAFGQRLQAAQRERRVRQTPKQRRPWPKRAPHKAPKPPRFLKLTAALKAILEKLQRVSE